MDIHMFIHEANRRLGILPRLIAPEDLRLVPDSERKGGWLLCCVTESSSNSTASTSGSSHNGKKLVTNSGETVEEIHRIGLELHQDEIAALSPDLLRQISLRCFNDMRTVLLTHDKRMLGVVKQDLQALVARKVLTLQQAQVLDLGIADTFLPGSPSLRSLHVACKIAPNLRTGYLLKPIRGGKGVGMLSWRVSRFAAKKSISERRMWYSGL